jgi:autotransporter-associated beta strand protein
MRIRRTKSYAVVITAAAVFAAVSRPAAAQFSNKITTTPVYIQDGFGPAGDQLPFDGLSYCFPTAFAMGLGYLGVNGFNQLAPAAPTQADGLNLTEVLAGLMGADPINGTGSNPGAAAGLETYLAAKGINPATAVTYPQGPTMSKLASVNQSGTAVILGFGYIDSSGNAVGGHAVTLLSQGVNAQGQSSPNTIVINNPGPGAFAPAADVPGSALQYLNTISTSGAVASQGAIELDPNQYPGYLSLATVVQAATVIQLSSSLLSSNNPTPATWDLESTQTLNLQGGSLSVIAPLTGSGGIKHGYAGTLVFEAANNTTGANTFVSGITQSDVASGLPFGTGSITLDATTLQLTPIDESAAVNLTLASGSGNELHFSDGAVLGLNRNGNTSLAVTIGGNTDGSTANISRAHAYATLTMVPASGLANLGSLESVIVKGSSGNLPAVTNGIVAPYIVGQDNDANSSGSFLTYGSSGFAVASYVLGSATAIASAGTAAVFDANVAQSLSTSGTAQVYALRVDGVAVTGGTASDLKVGNQTSGEGGIILNGGTINTRYLDFGSNQGVIYGNLSGGTIAAVIRSGSLDVLGPGSVTLTAANTYSGGTYVSSGMLVAANASGTATGSGGVDVREHAALMISGPSAKVGSSAGVTIEDGGLMVLNGGTVNGPLTMNGALVGFGTISASATINGYIGHPSGATGYEQFTPGWNSNYAGVENITFAGSYTLLDSSTTYSWRLNALDDVPSDAGLNWSLLTFTTITGSAYFGTPTSPVNVSLDLGANVPDPNSGNAFWNQPHQWLIATEPYVFNWYNPNFGAAPYGQGYFSITLNPVGTDVYAVYTPDQWQTNSQSASWFGTQNWLTVIPNGANAAANFWNLGGGTVDLGSNSATVSVLSFNSSGSSSYNIISSGGGRLVLTGSGSGPASVQVLAGSQTISAPLQLDSVVDVTLASPYASLTLSGIVSGSGALNLAGSGELILLGADSYQGGTIVLGGTLVAASVYALPRGTSLTVGAGATLFLDPSAAGSPVMNSAAAVAVPEPEALALLSVAACVLAVYQRIRSRRKML